MVFANLFIGYNEAEDFRVLICAWDEQEAYELSEEYRLDSKLSGHFEINEVKGGIDNIHFDCDYVIA